MPPGPSASPVSLHGPVALVRVALAVLLGVHGIYRALSGGAWHFGVYLEGEGLPFGAAIAWSITVFEIVAAPLLAAGRLVRVVAPGFAAILLGGIFMVHAPEGWFVVGGGRNGVEYSVLLLVCLAAVTWADRLARRPAQEPVQSAPASR